MGDEGVCPPMIGRREKYWPMIRWEDQTIPLYPTIMTILDVTVVAH